jgi:hypothetical protein
MFSFVVGLPTAAKESVEEFIINKLSVTKTKEMFGCLK